MRLKALGRKISPETKSKMRMAKLGKELTSEHKSKISKSLRGKKRSKLTRHKLSLSKLGKLNPNWKGGVVSYRSIHMYLSKKYGRADICENRERGRFPFLCSGKSNNFSWAKKKGRQYTLSINDYYKLCVSCHKKYDSEFYGTKSK